MWKFVLMLGLLMFVTSCNYGARDSELSASPTEKPVSLTTESTLSFPSTVDLVFKPLQTEPLKEGSPKVEWSLVKEIPFGEANQNQVVLDIYQESANNNSIPVLHAFVRVQNQKIYYSIQKELMETPQVDNKTMYLFQHKFSDPFIFLGGIQLYSNGPGYFAYIVYDTVNDQWFTFEDWGKPQFVDLDSNGQEEFVIQFEGLHLNLPDLTVYTYNQGAIEVSETAKTAVLGLEDANKASAIIENDKLITIKGERNSLQFAKYIYKNRKLIKIKGM
jgi:hypothetical protein